MGEAEGGAWTMNCGTGVGLAGYLDGLNEREGKKGREGKVEGR